MSSSSAKVIRYAIYTRQSTDNGDEFSSCQVQFATCQAAGNARGVPHLHWIGQHFDDEGFSGATLDRPGVRRLRKVIDLGGIDRLYAVALDRLTRSMRDAVVLLDEFEKAGVELRLVNQPELTTQPEGRFLRHMLAAFAEFERDMIATRIAETRAYLKKHGRRLAGPPPFGYDTDPITKQLVPNKAEARRVRAMFKRAASGQTPSQIAERVNHLGWRTKQWTSRRSGQQRGGGRWTARKVSRLLRSPVYLGRFATPDGDRAGVHAAIISQGVFDAVQAQLAGRRASSSPKRRPVHFPLRGKIICPRCGRPVSTYTITKPLGTRAKKTLRYYRCRSTAGGRRPCRGVSYPAAEVERIVRDQLADVGTWQEILQQANADPSMAVGLAALWQAMGQPAQDDVLPAIVQSVRFLERNSRIRTSLQPSVIDIIRR